MLFRSPECPADAIYTENELPQEQEKFLSLNRELATHWPNISEAKLPPDDADDWLDKPGKHALLEKNWSA